MVKHLYFISSLSFAFAAVRVHVYIEIGTNQRAKVQKKFNSRKFFLEKCYKKGFYNDNLAELPKKCGKNAPQNYRLTAIF